jgi:hypothetical protein
VPHVPPRKERDDLAHPDYRVNGARRLPKNKVERQGDSEYQDIFHISP